MDQMSLELHSGVPPKAALILWFIFDFLKSAYYDSLLKTTEPKVAPMLVCRVWLLDSAAAAYCPSQASASRLGHWLLAAVIYSLLLLFLLAPLHNISTVTIVLCRPQNAGTQWCTCPQRFCMSGLHSFMLATFVAAAYFDYVSKMHFSGFLAAVINKLILFPGILLVIRILVLVPYLLMAIYNTSHWLACKRTEPWALIVPGCNAMFHVTQRGEAHFRQRNERSPRYGFFRYGDTIIITEL